MVPEFLIKKLEKQYGAELTKKILLGYKKRKTTLRVNLLKSSKDEIKNELKKENIEFKEVSFDENALIIETDESLGNLDIFKDGKIYIQSLSSMIPVNVLNPNPNENILDMTAAPRRKNFANSLINRR